MCCVSIHCQQDHRTWTLHKLLRMTLGRISEQRGTEEQQAVTSQTHPGGNQAAPFREREIMVLVWTHLLRMIVR